MKKILNFVGTPISNLDDITVRALRTLKESDVIIAESIRYITTLLKHHGISYPVEKIFVYDGEKIKLKEIIPVIEEHGNISYVSDSGMPVFMDPGLELLRYAEKQGYNVRVIPGISALSVALVYGGINSSFYFAGFPPRETYLRSRFIKNLENYEAVLLYEAPYRNKKLVEEFRKFLTSSWNITVMMDLTGEHEKVIRTTLHDIPKYVSQLEKKPAVFVLQKIPEKR